MQKSTRITLALDVRSRADAVRIVEATKDSIDAVKVGWPLILAAGPDIIADIAKFKEVICDMKIADIPSVNALIVEQAMKRGASAVICHGFVGEDSVKACADAAKGQVFVVTEMSHPGGKQFTAPVADKLAALAKSAGARGIVAPATRPERIAELRRIIGGLEIISPGVGAQGGKASDAIRAGADYIIVGRAIYDAPDPKHPEHRILHRLVTTLLDEALYPALKLVAAYHERWEIENAIDEVDTHLRAERPILTSKKPAGVVQEIYGILIAHYAVRKVIFEAAEQVAVDPDRVSFVGALRLIRDALPELDASSTEQARVRRYAVLLEDIGKELNPPRRSRNYPRVVKRKMSKFPLKRPKVHGRQLKTTPFLDTVRIA